MQAYVVRKPGRLQDVESTRIETPAVGGDQVRVRVKAAAVNPADVKVATGAPGAGFIHSKEPPVRLGYDFSGMVEAVGPGVADFAEGDAVFGFLPYARTTTQGSFAEALVVSPRTIARKPQAASHVEAATAATTAVTALQSLVDIGGIAAGQRVLVNGASGGVGSYAVQIARDLGAEVWGVCSARSRDHVAALGADRVVDYRETAPESLAETFDIVFDVASNSSPGRMSRILAPRGVYVTLLPSLGFFTGKLRALFSGRRCALCMVRPKTESLRRIAAMIEQGRLTTPVAATYPFERLPAALEAVAAGGVQGKVGIVVED